MTGFVLTHLVDNYGGQKEDYFNYIFYFYTVLALAKTILYLFLDEQNVQREIQLQVEEEGE